MSSAVCVPCLSIGKVDLPQRWLRAGLVAEIAMLVVLFLPGKPLAAQSAYVGQPLGSGFNEPIGVAVDSQGNVFVAGNGDNAVEEIPVNCQSSACGNTPLLPLEPHSFGRPVGVAVDASDNVYVTTSDDYKVKEVPAFCFLSTCVKTLGGSFNNPGGVAVDGIGNIYVADANNGEVKEIPLSCINGANNSSCVITLGGNFNYPVGVALDSSGNVYVADAAGQAVKEIPVSCINGANNASCVITLGGGFFYPVGVAVDSSGFVYVIDHTPTTSSLVKEMVNTCTSSSCVGTLGGGFAGLQGVAVDGSGNVYVSVSNSNNNEVIEVVRHGVSFPSTNVGSSTTATVTFTIWSGGAIGTPAVVTQGSSGRDFTDTGTGTCTTTNGAGNSYSADATCTVDVTFAPKFAGTRYGAVELTDTSGAVIATAYVYGTGKGPQVVFNAPLTPATLGGGFNSPSGTAMDGSGNVYVADAFNHAVKEIPAGCALSGCVITVGGGFGQPQGVAVDGSGNIFVADPGNNAVYEMASTCRSSGCVSSLGGGFYNPSGVAVDSNRNVYVADSSNRVVKVMSSLCTSPGCVSMLGGGFSQFYGVAVDGSGNVYVADTNYNAVRKMANTCTSSSCVTTLGGGFNTPQGIAVDGNGNVYVADAGNNAVKVMANTCTSTLYASSSCTVTTLGSGYSYPAGVAVDGSGNVYVANTGNNAVKELNRAAPALNFATTAVGAASSDSPKTLVLQNIGNSALTFLAPASGGNPSISTGFSIGNASTCPQLTPSSSAGTLASGASCTDVISFTPVAKGNDSGSVEITDNTLNVSPSTQTISLSGTATAGSKTINFTQPASPVYAGTGATLVATASNGDAVTFSVTNGTGTATVIGSTISYLTPGTVTVHADSAVTSNYNAAPTVSYSVTIQIGPLVFLAGSGKVASLSSSGGVTSSGVAGGGIGAAVDQNGLVFSITADGTGISTFNPDGTLANTSSGVLTGASALAIDGTDQLWIAFPGGLSTAQILGAGTGSVTDSTLQKPGGVAIDVSGNVWVSDSQSNTVHEIIGGAAPAEPLANAVQSATPGAKP